jgi:hypothetical protein
VGDGGRSSEAMVRGFVYLIALLLYFDDKECVDEMRAKRLRLLLYKNRRRGKRRRERRKIWPFDDDA